MERKRKYPNNLIQSPRNHGQNQPEREIKEERVVKQIITPYDYDQLQRNYKFVLEEDLESKSQDEKKVTTWQERMVRQYHSHLYKTHVIADFSKYETASSQIGLRWRTKAEVASGFGVDTCGNKNCPCYFMNSLGETKVKSKVEDVIKWSKAHSGYYQSSNESVNHDQNQKTQAQKNLKHERQRLDCIPYGIGLYDYQVHFSYTEEGVSKEELVKLKLCLRCAPILFRFRGGEIGAKNARQQFVVQTEKDLDQVET